MKKLKNRVLHAVIFCIPLLLGVYGYCALEGESLPNGLFMTICFYVLNNGNVPPNLFVEAARWLAPLMTASGVILAVSILRREISDYLTYLRGDSIAVYGEEEKRDALLSQLGKRGIRGEKKLVRAGQYILLGDESESFAFYESHRDLLRTKPVYIRCDSTRLGVADANVKQFCEEEMAARLFWKQSGLFEEVLRKTGQPDTPSCDSDFLRKSEQSEPFRIVFAEFGRIEQELLIWGLQDNIFHPKQNLEYHIFGDSRAFQALYRQLGQIEDTIVFHTEAWYENLSILEAADRILLSDPATLEEILFALPGKTPDILAESARLSLLENDGRFRVFDWQKEVRKPENILGETLYTRAKRINLRYAHIYSGVEETDENMEAEWAKLNAFTRYSNISAADYHEIRLQMLDAWKKTSGKNEPDVPYMEQMSELEHIRWCRFHYLNNWQYGIPANGKNKDPQTRIHTDLIPYSQLSEEDKEKDRENIRILMGL